MPNHSNYPDAAPIPCIAQTINIIRTGEVSEKKEELFLHLWNIQGYAQKVLLGEPEQDVHLLAGNNEQQLVALESALTDMQNTLNAQLFGDASEPQAAMDPATIIALVSLVLKLISKWRNR